MAKIKVACFFLGHGVYTLLLCYVMLRYYRNIDIDAYFIKACTQKRTLVCKTTSVSPSRHDNRNGTGRRRPE